MIVVVARDEGVIGIDRKVNAWAERGVATRHQDTLADGDKIKCRIENRSPDQLVIVGYVRFASRKNDAFPRFKGPLKFPPIWRIWNGVRLGEVV